MKSIKVKRPKLPRCPSLMDIRGDFRDANKQIRVARHKYWLACWQQGEQLTGDALLRFVFRAGKAMHASGLYAEKYPLSFIVYRGVKFFFEQSTGHNCFAYWAFHHWKIKNKVTDIRAFCRGRAAA